MVMPLLGQSLDDEIKQQPDSWERATEIVAGWVATVDPAAGTIIGTLAGELPCRLLFIPFAS